MSDKRGWWRWDEMGDVRAEGGRKALRQCAQNEGRTRGLNVKTHLQA